LVKKNGKYVATKRRAAILPALSSKECDGRKSKTMSVKLTTSNQKNPPAGPLGSFGATWLDRAGMLA
jgi:hypothetical protein